MKLKCIKRGGFERAASFVFDIFIIPDKLVICNIIGKIISLG